MGFLFSGHYFLFKKEKTIPAKKNFLKGAICSSVAGFSSFCVHAGGTPTSLYLLPLRMKKEIYVGTRIIFFSCVNLIKLPLYVYLSMMNFDTLYQSVTLFPLALIGIFIGYKLLKIIEENLFYNIIYALILVSSFKLILDFMVWLGFNFLKPNKFITKRKGIIIMNINSINSVNIMLISLISYAEFGIFSWNFKFYVLFKYWGAF